MGAITDFFLDAATQSLVAYAGRPRIADIQGQVPGASFMLPPNVPQTNVLELPFVDVIAEAPTGGCGGSPVYKKVCGAYKWVTPKRRRRKQLLTKSDAKGLAALKGILGNGKAMETWIATHT